MIRLFLLLAALLTGCQGSIEPTDDLDRIRNAIWRSRGTLALTMLDDTVDSCTVQDLRLQALVVAGDVSLSEDIAALARYRRECDQKFAAREKNRLLVLGDIDAACSIDDESDVFWLRHCAAVMPGADERIDPNNMSAEYLSALAHYYASTDRRAEAMEKAIAALRKGAIDAGTLHLTASFGALDGSVDSPAWRWREVAAIGLEATYAGHDVAVAVQTAAAERGIEVLPARPCESARQCAAAGVEAERSGDLIRALARYKESTHFAPEHPPHRARVIHALMRLGLNDEAESQLAIGFSQRQNVAEFHYLRAELMSRMYPSADSDQVLADLERAVELAPWETAWRIRLASVHVQRGDRRQAIRAIDDPSVADAPEIRQFKLENGLAE